MVNTKVCYTFFRNILVIYLNLRCPEMLAQQSELNHNKSNSPQNSYILYKMTQFMIKKKKFYSKVHQTQPYEGIKVLNKHIRSNNSHAWKEKNTKKTKSVLGEISEINFKITKSVLGILMWKICDKMNSCLWQKIN